MTATGRAQRDRLIESGLLVPTGTAGLFGLSGGFNRIIAGLEVLLGRAGADRAPETVRFPPVVPGEVFEKSGYLRSFPNLAGALYGFEGGDAEHAELLRRFESGLDWTQGLVPSGSVLCAAACHPLYSTIPSPLPDGGRNWDVYGWVFRHEPSDDPARMQSFRQYEFVHVGDAESALAHRQLWLERAVSVLSGLGIQVRSEVAHDPFFGRAGRLLVADQQSRELKFEILAPTQESEHLTAIASINYHEDHFGSAFSLAASDGNPAHSACVGFGVERIALALLWQHGLDVDRWPEPVRKDLSL